MQQRPEPYDECFVKLGAILPFFIDWEEALEIRWPGAGHTVPQDFLVRPTQATGFQYRCTSAGATGDDEPAWLDSGVVADGSAEWTPEPITGASLVSSISGTPTWLVPSGCGIALSQPAISGLVTSIRVDATAAIAPGDYDLVNTAVLLDGTNRIGTWRLKVR